MKNKFAKAHSNDDLCHKRQQVKERQKPAPEELLDIGWTCRLRQDFTRDKGGEERFEKAIRKRKVAWRRVASGTKEANERFVERDDTLRLRPMQAAGNMVMSEAVRLGHLPRFLEVRPRGVDHEVLVELHKEVRVVTVVSHFWSVRVRNDTDGLVWSPRPDI